MRPFNDDMDEEVTVNILPMIDIIFAILSYFIISSLFLTRSDGLSVNLPTAETTERQPDATFTVTVEEDGDIFLDSTAVQASEIQSAINQQLADGQAAAITIKADEKASHGAVVSVMDELRQIEDAKLAIATQAGN